DRGIIPGIKVDKGTVVLPGTPDEYTTQGLDGLNDRCAQYKKDGCHFAKWRCVLKISERTPSYLAMKENANVLARYAVICQQTISNPLPMVVYLKHTVRSPTLFIVDPYLRLQLSTVKMLHSVHRNSYYVPLTRMPTNDRLFSALREGTQKLRESIVFLSGGMSEAEATQNLNAINVTTGRKPWALTFSFGRALQASVIQTWNGMKSNVASAQQELLKLAQSSSLPGKRK
ncbi:fructose-bisphosphate aldolase, class I, partial [Paragonimus westermani]